MMSSSVAYMVLLDGPDGEVYYTSLETLDAAREYAQESTSEAQPLEWIDGTEARVDDTHKWVIREED